MNSWDVSVVDLENTMHRAAKAKSIVSTLSTKKHARPAIKRLPRMHDRHHKLPNILPTPPAEVHTGRKRSAEDYFSSSETLPAQKKSRGEESAPLNTADSPLALYRQSIVSTTSKKRGAPDCGQDSGRSSEFEGAQKKFREKGMSKSTSDRISFARFSTDDCATTYR